MIVGAEDASAVVGGLRIDTFGATASVELSPWALPTPWVVNLI